MIYSVALDGPGGAGKSTIAKEIAKQKNIVYVDTGAMYRAIGLYMLCNGIDINDSRAVCAALPAVDIKLEYTDGAQRIILCGKDVSAEIRKNEVSMAASTVSAYPVVRQFLLETQRSLAKTQSVIMDGRDIGTYVLPDADLKVYLTATSAERARRRCLENEEKGIFCDFDEVKKDIEYRDRQDSEREFA
ncbi:MAG: (d)CMP kinase, partial [Oscillospiraceae bacterium]|nr:(d)CMP kinase [Oscillospiraceae bacterium]